MPRPTAFSPIFNLLKLGSAMAFVLATALSCGEYSTSAVATPDGITRVHVQSVDIILPDSLKLGDTPEDVSPNYVAPIGLVANVLARPFTPAATIAAGACGGGGAAPTYTESRVDFTPEPVPMQAAFASDLKDDGVFPVDLKFNFTFHGNTYNSVNVYSNGFLLFGALPAAKPLANGQLIAAPSTPNNIIALAWADWSPQNVPDGIRFETKGSAPNRKFVLQFNNVPEFGNTGVLMSQVVLTEGTNEISIYTNKMTTIMSGHVVTQGIENSTGTYALYDTFFNPILNRTLARVKNNFKLDNDAIRFTPVSTKDVTAPTFDAAPVNLSQFNDPGLATAVVAVVPPTAKDDCSTPTVTWVRSDGGLSLDAPFPVGVTTITWTAKDADGNTSTATQTVTVIDNEDPTLTVQDTTVNATSKNGAAVNFVYSAHDNVGVTSVVCDPLSGSVIPIPGGTVSCTASDAAGNTYTATFTVHVLDAHAQMENLMTYLLGLADVSDGTRYPLANQLRAAYDGNNSCKKMSDFISMASKKAGGLPSGAGAYMTDEATRIMAVMGCTSGPALTRMFNPTLVGHLSLTKLR